ncbi:MAG TPA: class I SAM-dependent methyltransferase [Pyrinomonadaceae bacterium]|nr:class I SAM-dependent methyltransferase [Pyrinomonadaceae bacterium]
MSSAELCLSDRQQQAHYDTISADYEAHYSDEWSLAYRRQFIYEPMFAGLDLSGMKILDAMCGTGQTTEYLLDRGADVTGLDISNEVIQSFRARWTNVHAVKRSLLDSGLPASSFDVVVVVGGLHHIHPNLNLAMQEIHRVLKPGGYLCFMEPHSGSFPDLIRRVWYKLDRYFSDNEEAIDMKALQRNFRSHFELKQANYLGNLAFLLVLNSLIFRVPTWAKKFYSPLLMKLEATIHKFQCKLTSCFVVAQWQKR